MFWKRKKDPAHYENCSHPGCNKVAVVYLHTRPNGKFSRYSCLEHEAAVREKQNYLKWANDTIRLYDKNGFIKPSSYEKEWEP